MMNFVTNFFESQNLIIKTFYDIIITIINDLIKYVKFILYQLTITTKQLTYLLIKKVFANYNVSKQIITNRDKLFISTFHKKLRKFLKILKKMLTTFYS